MEELVEKAYQMRKLLNETPGARYALESRWKREMDEAARVREAQLRLEAAFEQGLKEGLKEGRAERLKLMNEEIASHLLAINTDVEAIAKGTGLSIEEVQKLKENMRLS